MIYNKIASEKLHDYTKKTTIIRISSMISAKNNDYGYRSKKPSGKQFSEGFFILHRLLKILLYHKHITYNRFISDLLWLY